MATPSSITCYRSPQLAYVAISPTLKNLYPILLILLLGAALRLPLLVRDSRFQVDEALYATFARHIAQTGDVLMSGMEVDKPPLLFLAMSGSFTMFGVSEFSARLPNTAASLLTLALVYALTKRLYGDRRVALVAVLLLAGSPYDRGFAATAYTDPLLTMFVLAGYWAIVRGRWRIGGLLLAVAVAVKPSALQWLPLALALGVTQLNKWQDAIRSSLKLMLGFAVGAIPLVIWSVARATWPDFWTLNWYNNNPGRFIRAEEFMPRLAQWGGWLQTIALLPIIGWLSAPLHWRSYPRLSRVVVIDLILSAYTLISLAELWLVAFNVYDRYLHTLAPLLLILLARVIVTVGDQLPLATKWRGRGVRFLFALIILALALFPAINAGGDPSIFAGIDQVAAVIDSLPGGTIVYDHWLGWELGFYLGSQPPVQVIWEPTVDALIAAIRQQPGYLIVPRHDLASWRYLMEAAGIKLIAIDVPDAPGFILAKAS